MNPGEQSDLPVEISKGIPTGTRGKKKGPHGIPRESSRTPVVTTTTHGNTRQFPWDTAEIPTDAPENRGDLHEPTAIMHNSHGISLFPTVFRGFSWESPRLPGFSHDIPWYSAGIPTGTPDIPGPNPYGNAR